MNLSEIIVKASEIGEPNSPEGRMERFEFLLDMVLPYLPGNLVEIGAGSGMTTNVLLRVAERHNRIVVVIDPFDPKGKPKSYNKPYPFQTFCDNIKDASRLTMCRMKSTDKKAIEVVVKHHPIAFVFLDGLQTFENVLYELMIFANINTPIICVDDMNRVTELSKVPLSVKAFLEGTSGYKIVETKPLQEGYLIK